MFYKSCRAELLGLLLTLPHHGLDVLELQLGQRLLAPDVDLRPAAGELHGLGLTVTPPDLQLPHHRPPRAGDHLGH